MSINSQLQNNHYCNSCHGDDDGDDDDDDEQQLLQLPLPCNGGDDGDNGDKAGKQKILRNPKKMNFLKIRILFPLSIEMNRATQVVQNWPAASEDFSNR